MPSFEVQRDTVFLVEASHSFRWTSFCSGRFFLEDSKWKVLS
jgi:hypothetical protein